jgi:hypothetical protein
MKKRSFSRAKSYRCQTRSMQRYIKYLKRLRSKRARKNVREWRKTNAWDVA